jgi:hypothetical protein
MITNLPTYVSVIFGLTTLATLLLFYWVLKNSKSESTQQNALKILGALIIWLVIQAILTIQNVYSSNTNSLPPKIFLFAVLPAFIAIIILFVTKKGRQFIDNLSLAHITYLNIIRIPVELVLWWLFFYKTVPELMTFEGRNFDIIAGVTAPFIAYFGIVKRKLSHRIILGWNILCLGLLVNIGINGFLSAPSPLQKFAFDQPNIAILAFPFSWLVSFVVPIVLFSHVSSIRQLLKRPEE